MRAFKWCTLIVVLFVFSVARFAHWVSCQQQEKPANVPNPIVVAKLKYPANLTCLSYKQPLTMCLWEKKAEIGQRRDIIQVTKGKDTDGEPTGMSGYSYVGAGLDRGECGIRIDNVKEGDSNVWSCTLFLVTGELLLGTVNVTILRPGMLEHDTYGDPTAVRLYIGTCFHGKKLNISWVNKNQCFNLGYDKESAMNFNKMVHSVDLTPSSTACLLLYSSAGCTGESLLVANWHNKSCLGSLDNCNWAFKVSSLSSCETQSINSNTSRIAPTNSGITPMNSLRASLYVKPEFQDNHITIDGIGETQCFTLGYDAELSINFNNALMSINLDNGACLHLYDRIGCLGTPVEVSLDRSPKCLWNLEACGMHRKVSSLSFCNTTFPSEYTSPVGVQGSPCSDSCNELLRNRTYFSCDVGHSWDFCSPRPGVNYFGENLVANVSYEEAAILYDQAQFKGHGATLNNSKNKLCHNLQEGGRENFSRHLASVDLRGSCLQIYDEIGCSGHFLEIVPQDVDNCHVDLRPCGWHDRVLSIRFCNAPWPEKFTQPNGSRGGHCNDSCDTRGKPYFWCHVQNGTSDYCLPRPGQDLFGNDCEENCMNLSDLDLIVSGSTEASASPRKDPRNMCLSVSLLVTNLWLHYLDF